MGHHTANCASCRWASHPRVGCSSLAILESRTHRDKQKKPRLLQDELHMQNLGQNNILSDFLLIFFPVYFITVSFKKEFAIYLISTFSSQTQGTSSGKWKE